MIAATVRPSSEVGRGDLHRVRLGVAGQRRQAPNLLPPDNSERRPAAPGQLRTVPRLPQAGHSQAARSAQVATLRSQPAAPRRPAVVDERADSGTGGSRQQAFRNAVCRHNKDIVARCAVKPFE